MHKRIRELALKAYNNAGQGTPEELSLFMEVYTEKFAELIVKECAEILQLVPYHSDKDFGNEAIYQESIYKHFGVK